MKNTSTYFVILATWLALAACAQFTTTSDENTDNSPRPDNDLVDVNELNLTPVCEVISQDQKTDVRIGCIVHDQNGERVNLLDLHAFDWSTRDESNAVITSDTSSTYDIEYVVPHDSVTESLEIVLSYQFKATSPTKEARVKVASLIADLSNIHQLRVFVDSITKSDPTKPQQLIYTIEFRVDGKWLAMEVDLASLSPKLGAYPVEFDNVDGTFLAMIMELNRTQPFDLESQKSFDPEAPHDAIADQPPTITVKFNKGVRVDGMRMNGGLRTSLDNIKTGFFDRFRVAVADAKGNFTTIESGQFDLAKNSDADALAYIWDTGCNSDSACECAGNTKEVCESDEESIYLVDLGGIINECATNEGTGEGWSCGPDYSCYKIDCLGECEFVAENVCFEKTPFAGD